MAEFKQTRKRGIIMVDTREYYYRNVDFDGESISWDDDFIKGERKIFVTVKNGTYYINYWNGDANKWDGKEISRKLGAFTVDELIEDFKDNTRWDTITDVEAFEVAKDRIWNFIRPKHDLSNEMAVHFYYGVPGSHKEYHWINVSKDLNDDECLMECKKCIEAWREDDEENIDWSKRDIEIVEVDDVQTDCELTFYRKIADCLSQLYSHSDYDHKPFTVIDAVRFVSSDGDYSVLKSEPTIDVATEDRLYYLMELLKKHTPEDIIKHTKEIGCNYKLVKQDVELLKKLGRYRE